MLVSTTTLGGHVDTIGSQGAGRRRRRLHSDEFKANAVAAAAQPGISMAAVALSLGINANLLRRWVREAEVPPVKPRTAVKALPSSCAGLAPSSFVPVPLPASAAAPGEIRLELRRGPMTVVVTWPAASAAECANWMRELLR